MFRERRGGSRFRYTPVIEGGHVAPVAHADTVDDPENQAILGS
jgi:hypothetical protein